MVKLLIHRDVKESDKLIATLAFIGACVAFCVIGLGAFTRLVDAGLGCPDWPGCYGKLIVAHVSYKAWAEMIHRYFAGTLSTIIFALILTVFVASQKRLNVIIALFLIALVIYQILLGKWTVTLHLLPIIVTQHLLGGFLIVCSLWLLFLNNRETTCASRRYLFWLPFAVIGLLLLMSQIFLGAWTSTNYASLSCDAFPYCSKTHLFSFQWREAFHIFSDGNANYEGGVLSLAARQTIQMMHRLGALIVTLYLFIFSMVGMTYYREKPIIKLFYALLALMFLQIILGISNVIFKLPLATAILHNLTATALLLTMITLVFRLSTEKARHL